MADRDLEVKVDWKRLNEAVQKVPLALYSRFRKRMTDHHRRFEHRLKTDNLKGGGVHRRSGFLSRGVQTKTSGTGVRDVEVSTYIFGVPYARVQELGGVIRPRRKKWLTIPLDAAKTGSGVLRARAPFWEDTFFRRSKKGNLILWQKKGDEIIPLFVLKKQVRLKPKLGFMRLWKHMEPAWAREFNRAVDEALEVVDERP